MHEASTPRALLDRKAAAAFYSISVRALEQRVSSGLIPPPIRLGGRVVRWRIADLEQHVESLAASES